MAVGTHMLRLMTGGEQLHPRLFLRDRLLPAHLLPEGFSEAAVAAGGKGASRDTADYRGQPVLTRGILLCIHVEVVAQFAAGDMSLIPAAVHGVSPVMLLLPPAGKHPYRNKKEQENKS